MSVHFDITWPLSVQTHGATFIATLRCRNTFPILGTVQCGEIPLISKVRVYVKK